MRGIQGQVQELRELKDGWLDGEGLAPTEAAMACVLSIIDEDALFRVYPMLDGGLSLEMNPSDDLDLLITIGSEGAVKKVSLVRLDSQNNT